MNDQPGQAEIVRRIRMALPSTPQPVTAPVADWTAGVVAIMGQEYQPIGTGFVVSQEGLIVTCAHVLDQAGWPFEGWETPLEVRFKAARGSARAFVLEGQMRSVVEGDMAVLALENGPPPGVAVLPLWTSAAATGHKCYMWGYPAEFREGARGEGEVLGLIPHNGQQVLQLRSTETTRGYSGGPIWDPEFERIIGMTLSGTRADEMGRLGFTTLAAAAEELVRQFPEMLTLTEPGQTGKLDLSGYDNRPLWKEMLARMGTHDDLQILAYMLEVDYANVNGSTPSIKALELIRHCERYKMVPELLQTLSELRDMVDWYAVAGVRKL